MATLYAKTASEITASLLAFAGVRPESAFAHFVIHVVLIGSQKPMSWVLAWRIVAGVANKHPSWNRPTSERPPITMRSVRKKALESQLPISIFINPLYPRPALAWASLDIRRMVNLLASWRDVIRITVFSNASVVRGAISTAVVFLSTAYYHTKRLWRAVLFIFNQRVSVKPPLSEMPAAKSIAVIFRRAERAAFHAANMAHGHYLCNRGLA